MRALIFLHGLRLKRLKYLMVFLTCTVQVFAQDKVADNMLMFQRDIGGWPKHFAEKAINYNREYTAVEKATIRDKSGRNDATIDNNATTKEIRYLVKAFKETGNKAYLAAAEKGIRYLLKAQYRNGGWPQFYPDFSSYHGEITFNDNAMINVLGVLNDVANGANNMDLVDKELVGPSAMAVKKGIDCILKTQVVVDGKLTAWCAQYDPVTLKPANARTFELASLSGDESVDIVEFLMKQPHPSEKIKKAVNSAVDWFRQVQLKGIRWASVVDSSLPAGRDRIVVPDSHSVLWARFYEIGTNEPFFSGRDGVKRKSVAEIEYERRNGYAWYGTWPKELLETEYPRWKAANN